MDNLCHTLVGLALAEAGLKRKTALGTATLVVGANLPDVDALSYFASPTAGLGFRRGWTHGALAVAVGPLLLAGLMMAWDRYVRRRRHPDTVPADPRWLALLALVAVASHPLLDLCNTYGVRLLMPFSGRWFYGDALFILDPWMLLVLAAGAAVSFLAARRGSVRPGVAAQAALAAVAAYILGMGASNLAARRAATRIWERAYGSHPHRIMTAPLPVTPFRRAVVVEAGDIYALGAFDWLGLPRYTPMMDALAKNDNLPEVAEAIGTPAGRAYLGWARFPYFTLEPSPAGPVVRMRDARYQGQPWAEVAIPVGRRLSLPSIPSVRRTP